MENEMRLPSKIPKLDKKERKRRGAHVPLAMFYDQDKFQYEIGIDEAGRGPLLGRVYIAAVVLPKDGSMDTSLIRDSKKIAKSKLAGLYAYIVKHALAYHVTFIEADEIDAINIRMAVIKGMHTCAREIISQLERRSVPMIKEKEKFCLMVDGNDFPPYIHVETQTRIAHETFIQGDNAYANIAAASILAKVARDNSIMDICRQFPMFDEMYGLKKNMGYGTKMHLDAIRKYGITRFHRRTFGICKSLDQVANN